MTCDSQNFDQNVEQNFFLQISSDSQVHSTKEDVSDQRGAKNGRNPNVVRRLLFLIIISKGFVAWDQVDFGQAAPPRWTDQLLRRCQHITGVPVLEFN